MDFLQGIEIVRLQKIVERHPKIRRAATRPAVLTLCGLDEGLSFLQTEGDADQFVTLLLAECRHHPTFCVKRSRKQTSRDMRLRVPSQQDLTRKKLQDRLPEVVGKCAF